ncbi:hypothetical protein [Streptomyces diastaticus]
MLSLVFVLALPIYSISASASESIDTENVHPEFDGATEGSVLQQAVSGNEDYEVVDVTYIPESQNDEKASTQAVSTWWETTRKDYQGIKYGGWKTLVERNSGNSGSITIKFTKTRSNSYSGQLKVAKKVMDAFVGFDIKKEYQVSVDDQHTGLSKKKTYLAQYRTRNKEWKVTQTQYELENWTGKKRKVGTKVITVKKQDGFNTRVKAK